MTIIQIIAAIGVGLVLTTPVFISLLRFAGYTLDDINWLLSNADRVKLVDAAARIVKKGQKVFGCAGDIVLKLYCIMPILITIILINIVVLGA